jgi:Flp pilus assembly pilin Flp
MKRTVLVRLWREESGVTAVELALLAAFVFVPLLLGATELGRRIWTMAQVDTSARAGVEYAMIACIKESKPPWCTSAMTNIAAINSAGTSATALSVTATSSTFYGCPTSTGVTPQTGTCSDLTGPGIYASVTATASYIPLFHSCGGLLPVTICPFSEAASSLSSTATSRIN